MITLDEVVQGYFNLVLRAERAEMRVKELEGQLAQAQVQLTKPSASQEVPDEAKKD